MNNPTLEKRQAFIGFYLTDREKSRIQDKADLDTRSVSDWVRIQVLRACDETNNSD